MIEWSQMMGALIALYSILFAGTWLVRRAWSTNLGMRCSAALSAIGLRIAYWLGAASALVGIGAGVGTVILVLAAIVMWAWGVVFG